MSDSSIRHVLVTGGAGFVGSHLVDRQCRRGRRVTVVDDLSTGRRAPAEAELIRGDLTEPSTIADVFERSYDRVYHLASRSAVDDAEPWRQFRENTAMTAGLLAAVLDADVPELVFTSSSTIYGEAPRPTPEDYAPLEPISAYGASKLACEALLSAAAHTTELTVYNLRFANIVGPGLRDAVIPDFIEKLRADPDRLLILGDGRQEKSYMHVEDCLEAIEHVCERAPGPFATYNLGTRTTTSVRRVAEIVADELGVDPTYEYTGGERGWTGDVPRMRLSIEKLAALGWEPARSSEPAVRKAADELASEIE